MLGFVQAVPGAALLSVVGYIGHLVSLLGSDGLDRLPPGTAGQEQVMVRKEHGTCPSPPSRSLRWGSDFQTADRISCFNRESAESAGYWETTGFLKTESAASGKINFYDSVTGRRVFEAPRGRSFGDFVAESRLHGWPSFRDEEVVAENVRVLPGGETVSLDGTHLGHNLPDWKGNRYRINLVSVSGQPLAGSGPAADAGVFPPGRSAGAAPPASGGAPTGPQRLQRLEEEQAELFQGAAPSVAVIFTEFPNMANLKMPDENHRQGVGSGIVWDKKGHIVTNFHVVNNAERATVALTDAGGLQRQYTARMTGMDPDTDIAVLKIDADEGDLRTIPVGDSTKTRVGQMSFAVGNIYGQERTLTAGVISGRGREIKAPSGRRIPGVLQTDAVIGPGNSGGPLLDSQGRIIGIVTASVSAGGPFSSARVAFAIPMSLAAPTIQQLIDTGRVDRAVLGVKYVETPTAAESERGGLPRVGEGVVVAGVFPGSSAEAAGLLVSRPPAAPEGRRTLGDVIVAIDDSRIRNPQDMRLTMSRYKPGETVDVTILRGQELEKRTLRVKLGAFQATQFSKLQDERSADSAAKTSPASLPPRA